MNIVARCNSLGEAQSLCFDLRSVGVDATIPEENLASWSIPRVPRSAIGIHVAVRSEDIEDATRYIAKHYPYLAPVKEESLCPECISSQRPPKPFTYGFVKTIWHFAIKVRIFGRTFCPACHSTWRPDTRIRRQK
jgi:hypothetical protein